MLVQVVFIKLDKRWFLLSFVQSIKFKIQFFINLFYVCVCKKIFLKFTSADSFGISVALYLQNVYNKLFENGGFLDAGILKNYVRYTVTYITIEFVVCNKKEHSVYIYIWCVMRYLHRLEYILPINYCSIVKVPRIISRVVVKFVYRVSLSFNMRWWRVKELNQ